MITRTPLVAGNWKMHKTASEAVELVAAFKPLREGVAVEVAVCPPFPSLQALHAVLEGSAIGLGAQNMHWENEGAHTGEISAGMLLEAGCTYVSLGHSERRQAGEIDEVVHRKLVAALEAGLRPIVCVGSFNSIWIRLVQAGEFSSRTPIVARSIRFKDLNWYVGRMI